MKTLSFVIPVYNEEKRIGKTIKALQKGFNFNGLKLKEVIFVDDGSTDQTKFTLEKAVFDLRKSLKAEIKIISYKKNKGKGFAVKTGMLASSADYTLLFDADMATPLNELSKFLPLIEKRVPVIIGTRKNGESTVKKPQPLYRQILGRGFTLLSNLTLNTWVTDFTCGFKAFSKEAKGEIFSKSTINRWGYDAEILFLAKKFGFEIQEKAVFWYDDKDSRVNLLKDLPQTFGELIKIRINHFQLPVSIKALNKYFLAKTSHLPILTD